MSSIEIAVILAAWARGTMLAIRGAGSTTPSAGEFWHGIALLTLGCACVLRLPAASWSLSARSLWDLQAQVVSWLPLVCARRCLDSALPWTCFLEPAILATLVVAALLLQVARRLADRLQAQRLIGLVYVAGDSR